jgi:SOS-response transcriptional repressor LexA
MRTVKRKSEQLKITLNGVSLMAHTRSSPIPLAYSLLSAGPAAEIDEGYALLDVNSLVTKGRDGYIAFVVTGDSMVPDIRAGFIVFVDTRRQPRTGDAVVVSINNENCIKLFDRTPTQYEPPRLFLVPRNGDYPTREIFPNDDFRVLGVICGHLAVY